MQHGPAEPRCLLPSLHKAAPDSPATPVAEMSPRGAVTPRVLLQVATPLREPKTPLAADRAAEGQDQQQATEHLQGNFDQMKSQLEDCVSTLTKLSCAASEADGLRKEGDALREQLRVCEGRLKDKDRRLADACSEADDQRQLACWLGEEAGELRASLAEAESQADGQRQLACQLGEEAGELRASLAQAESQQSACQRSLEQERELSASHCASIEELRGRLSAAEGAAAQQRASAERRVAEAERELADGRRREQGLEERGAQLESELSQAELASAQLESDLSHRRDELEALRSELDRMESRVHSSEASRAEAEQRAHRLGASEQRLVAEQDRNSQLQTKLAQWEDMLDQARAEATQQQQVREREIDALHARAQQAQAAQRELQLSREAAAHQQEEIRQLEGLVGELREQAEQHQGRLDEQAKEQQGLLRMLDERSGQLRGKHEEAACLREEVAHLREALEAVNREQAHKQAQEQLASGLSEQNRELILTLRQFKQELELAEVENRSLRETVALFEEDMDRVNGQTAKAIGHMNHKQKIRYTLKLKEEINRLFGELKRSRQRIVQLEVSRDGEGLLDALMSVGQQLAAGGGRASLARSPPRGPSASPPRAGAADAGVPPVAPRRLSVAFTPSRCSPPRASPRPSASPRGGAEPARAEVSRLREAERRCSLQEQALERISVDFQHMRLLIERLVMLSDPEQAHAAAGQAASFSGLLRRLRQLISEAQQTSNGNVFELTAMEEAEEEDTQSSRLNERPLPVPEL